MFSFQHRRKAGVSSRSWAVLLAIATPIPVAAQETRSADALANEIDSRAAAIETKVIAWRRDLHEHPELANAERRTSALVVAHLKKLGYEVRAGLAGGTGVVGILKGARPGPLVAIRADMDALPLKEEPNVPFASKVVADWGGVQSPVMHACGHDAHTAILMGAAEIFAGMRDKMSGSVMVVFQPAEESAPPGWPGLSGAERMLRDGDFSRPKPDVFFGLHLTAATRGNAGKLVVGAGPLSYGISQFRVTITGKGAHGARPWEGDDTVVTAAQTLMALQTIPSRNVDVYTDDVTISVGAVRGANGFNVLPASIELEGALRQTNMAERPRLMKRVEQVVSNIAESAGQAAKVEWISYNPPIINDAALASDARVILAKAGNAPGDVIPFSQAQAIGVDDFSVLNELTPTFFLLLGASRDLADPKPVAGHHNPGFFVNEKALAVGVRAEVLLAFDYMARHPAAGR